ncbi:MAG: hypothetical protein RLN90_14565 [Balneolaceae bacterium]
MEFLDSIGLSKSIEIPISGTKEDFEKQLLHFKKSKKDKLGFLHSSNFVPSELTLKNDEFVFSKNPRFFRPFATLGEIRGELTPNERNSIEARVFSLYWLLLFMIFITTIMSAFGIYIANASTFKFTLIWLLALQLFNVLVYSKLRFSKNRLEREFRKFINEEILSKAP